jgi:hypothetical protein
VFGRRAESTRQLTCRLRHAERTARVSPARAGSILAMSIFFIVIIDPVICEPR